MAFRRSILACAALLLACGDDAAMDGGTDGSTSSASSDPSTSDPSTSASASSTDMPTATSASTTDPTVSSTTTDTSETSVDPDGSSSESSSEATDPSTSSDGSSSSDGESSSDTGNGDSEYRAIALIGELNRVRIFKRNDAADLCTFISLVDPSFGELGSIAVTQPWGVEFAGISDSAAACDSDTPMMFGSDGATDGSGTVDLGDVGVGGVPCTVDIDIELVFDGAVLQVPGMDTMTTEDLPVQGC